jgi:hypothetical protein
MKKVLESRLEALEESRKLARRSVINPYLEYCNFVEKSGTEPDGRGETCRSLVTEDALLL